MEKVKIYFDEETANVQKREIELSLDQAKAIINEYAKLGYGSLKSFQDFIKNPIEYIGIQAIKAAGLSVEHLDPNKAYFALKKPANYENVLNLFNKFKASKGIINMSFIETPELKIKSDAFKNIDEKHSYYLSDPDKIASFKSLQKIVSGINELTKTSPELDFMAIGSLLQNDGKGQIMLKLNKVAYI